ncbi:hypothetical protein ACHAXR_006900 [Thalassiosira sp. AJA248-18]
MTTIHDEWCAPSSSFQPSSSPPPPPPQSNSSGRIKPTNRRIITLPLLRKRSEHNEGLVSSLEELALHQEELQSIGPILGRTCGKTLKILLLQNNVIDRMVPSELKLFRSLEYLNLALNNITKVEGIGGMEWLRKLDLTLNFIDVDTLKESVDELSECRSLEELFLIGNPCMGLDDGGGIPGAATAAEDAAAPPSSTQKQIGWNGCHAYIVARLPTIQFLDGKEIKKSERILAMQQLPGLILELHSLAEARKKERHLQNQTRPNNDECDIDDELAIDETYISDDAPTHHNPETRTKISNELYDQKQAKEKQETANHVPKPKGEKEWEEEHRDTVQKVREREDELGRERESNIINTDGNKKEAGGFKQCNQGKYHFWFEDDSKVNGDGKQKSGTLIMRVAIPKHLSTSLIDVDIHPTYVSIVVKSKILRVILPVEVLSDQGVARRSASSGYLELVMPKVNPNEVVIGLGHVRDRNNNNAKKETEGPGKEGCTTKGSFAQKKRERLGQSIMKEAGKVHSLNIVQNQASGGLNPVLNNCDDDSDQDEPPPLC